MTDGVVVTIASAKGGVGKTTTSLNLGALLAADGQSVVVAEIDLGMTSVVDALGIDADPGSDPTLNDVLAGEVAVADAVYRAPSDFDVIASGPADGAVVSPNIEALGEVVEALREAYDVVILDTPPGVSHETLLPLALADAVVVVSTPRVASVRDTKKTRELAERVGGTVVGVVFAMSGTGTAPSAEYLADFLSIELLGHVPDDEAVPDSQDAGVPVVNYAPESPAARGYRAAAKRLVEALDADRGRREAGEDQKR